MMKALILILVAACVVEALAQQRAIPQRKQKKDSIIKRGAVVPNAQQVDARKLFGQIEHGIMSSTLTSSPVPFARQVFINISGGESGYFSENQAVSVLQTYFSGRAPISFQFTRFSDKGPNPYATGWFTFVSRGPRESAQIYVSLVHQEARWVISQFNVY